MDINKVEMSAVQAVEATIADAVIELKDFELVLIGGGCGDISLG
jgi:hypothetical protein